MVQGRMHTSHCSAVLVYSLPSTTGLYIITSLYGCEVTSNIDTSMNFKHMRVIGHLDLPVSRFLDISYLPRSVDEFIHPKSAQISGVELTQRTVDHGAPSSECSFPWESLSVKKSILRLQVTLNQCVLILLIGAPVWVYPDQAVPCDKIDTNSGSARHGGVTAVEISRYLSLFLGHIGCRKHVTQQYSRILTAVQQDMEELPQWGNIAIFKPVSWSILASDRVCWDRLAQILTAVQQDMEELPQWGNIAIFKPVSWSILASLLGPFGTDTNSSSARHGGVTAVGTYRDI
ncbi:hypothetical protein J6590_066063 [Homalodisca vitripennis]|nr:hypothetical protein J6590_066063 [Homalodisca vitripennis]